MEKINILVVYKSDPWNNRNTSNFRSKDGEFNSHRIYIQFDFIYLYVLKKLINTTELDFNKYFGVGLDRAGGSGKPSLPVCDPLASTRMLELALNGRAMIFLSRAHEMLPLPPCYPKTLYIEGLPPEDSRREVALIYSYVIY
ncbi:hypothetical protein EJD97_006919 [Solanum chilense]|uniref:Uncharacterized protein n=1 Tax=Solanum chilense TaxID=4083 RepID=A0A6N2CEH0_SOLCI|nr:hypothetical protein EJD97_006919 [Solanum chilense]